MTDVFTDQAVIQPPQSSTPLLPPPKKKKYKGRTKMAQAVDCYLSCQFNLLLQCLLGLGLISYSCLSHLYRLLELMTQRRQLLTKVVVLHEKNKKIKYSTQSTYIQNSPVLKRKNFAEKLLQQQQQKNIHDFLRICC